MSKRVSKIWVLLLMALILTCCSGLAAMAAEQSQNLTAESMEIRMDGKLGLRAISSIDKDYYEELQASGTEFEYGTVAVPASALEANAGQELELNRTYTLNGKGYSSMKIPAERNWAVTEEKVYFTGVLTGIKGAGFNTRYAVRPYVTVNGKTTYGSVLSQSSYAAAQNMASSPEVSTDTKSQVASEVIDACDDAKKVTKDRLVISAADLKEGSYQLEATSAVRNYKEVVVDASVESGSINLSNIRIRKLSVSPEASVTVNAEKVIFDEITTDGAQSKRAALGAFQLNLGNNSNVTKLVVGSNMTVTGALKIAEVTVEALVEMFELNSYVESFVLSPNASGSHIVINSTVENAVLEGNDSTITGNGKIEQSDNKGNNQVEVEVGEEIPQNSITSVEVKGWNRMIVKLEKPTETPLTKEDMAIICRGGKLMTILSASTEDNQVYDITTSTFAKDDTYTFSIEIAENQVIQKEFYHKINCPIAENASVLRSEKTRAEFDLFGVDEGGKVYIYIPGHTQVAGKATEMPSVETVKKGFSQDMKTGFNKVILAGLQEGISYNLYYVLEAFDGRTSDVQGPLRINGQVEEDPNISKVYSIVSVEEKPQNTITIQLNKAPEEELSLDNFSFICPANSEITTNVAKLYVSDDRLTYTIVIPENYGHKDNQYTAKITFNDGTVAKKNFTVHFAAPRITAEKVERIAEDRVKYSFNSDESGTYYIGTYTWNGAVNSENNTPTADQILSGAVTITLKQMDNGYNEIEVPFNGTDQDVFVLHVDEAGNYANYTAHTAIPVYQPPVKPEEPAVEITEIVYNKVYTDYYNGTCLDITFSGELDWYPGQNDIKFAVVSGGQTPGRLMLTTSFIDNDPTRVRVQVSNYYKFKAGTYKIIMTVEKDGKFHKVEKEFVID